MESTTSEYKESKEQLQSCLVDLFQAPTKGIDEAFTLILGLMKSQEEKNQESWLQIEQRNNELVQKLSECQESNNVMKIEFGSQIDDMQNLITSLKKERDDLLKQNEDIIVKQSSLEKQIVEMNEEVKTMAHNLQLETTDDVIDENEESSFDESEKIACVSGSENIDEDINVDSHENRNEPLEKTEEALDNCLEKEDKLAAEGQASENQSSEGQSSEGQSPEEEQVLERKPSQSTLNSQSTSRSSSPLERNRRTSVISHRLKHHETLAARLDRIESDKEKVKNDLIYLKNIVDNLPVPQSSNSLTLSENSENIIKGVHNRLAALEEFLEGFGVTEKDVEENTTAEAEYNRKVDSKDEKKSVSRKRARTDDSGERDTVDSESEIEELEDEITDNQIESPTATTTQAKETSEQETTEEQVSAQDTIEVETIGEVAKGEIDKIINVTEERKEATDTKPIEAPKPISETKEAPRITDHEKQGSSRRSQGLLLHLVAQEKRFKEDIDSMLKRLMILENEKISYTGSLNKFITEIRSQLDEIKLRSGNNEGSNFDDSELNTKIEEIQAALVEVQNEFESKISKADLAKELERYQSSNILSSLQATSKEVDGDMLKKLNDFIQNELDRLRSQKLDKNAFNKKIEEIRSQMMGNLTKSISAQESNFMNSITKVEIDINDCKDSISMIENMLETKYVDANEFNLDEKIKNATEAMESNLQEIISSRMNCLKAMEDEVEKIASGLADKPDQDQINDMLRNLEETVMKQVGNDDAFQSMLESMKAELKQKTTRKEVIYLAKQLLNGAKEDVKRTSSSSLMIGHKAFRCLGCDEVHPLGVNNCLAPKVNHNSLPKGRGLAPAIYPYCNNGSTKLGRGALRPLHRSQSSIDSLRRSRRSLSGNKKYTRRSR